MERPCLLGRPGRREKTRPDSSGAGLGGAGHAWIAAAGIEYGRLLRSIRKGGKNIGEGLSDWAVWAVVQRSAAEIGIERFSAHNLRRTCAKLCRKAGGDLEQIRFLLGHFSIQTTERYLGSEQEIATTVNYDLGL